jgi:hypothetical protein
MKKIKKNYYYYFFLITLPLIISFYTNNFFYKSLEIQLWYRGLDEIVYIYNALIINNGFQQEYLDHPGFFSILILSILFKILYLFSIIDISTINQLNASINLEKDLNEIFFVARLFFCLVSSIFTVIIFKITQLISRDDLVAFLMSLIFFFSTGNISNLNIIDTPLLSALFLFLSFYSLLIFLSNKKNNILYLFLFFIFAYSSILQKIQSFIFIIPVFCSVLFLTKKSKDLEISFLRISNYKNIYFYMIIIFITLLIFIKSIVIYRSVGSALFLIGNYYLINYLFFRYSKKYLNKTVQNLILFNIILIFSYVFLKIVLTFHPGLNLEIFNISFGKIIKNISTFASDQNINENFGIINFIIIFTKNFINNFFLILKKNTLQINFQSLLFFMTLIILIFNYKNITSNKIKINIILLIVFYFFSQIINLFRQKMHYEIYSELFLIICCALIYRFSNKQKSIKLFIAASSIFLIIESLKIIETNKIHNNDRKGECIKIINDRNNMNAYISIWTPRIDQNIFKDLCGKI